MAEENKTPENEEINYTTNTFPSEEDNVPTAKSDELAPSNEINEEFIKPKKSLVFKILIGVISVLILFIIIGAILYFIGFFEHKEETPAQQVDPQHVEAVQHVEKTEMKEESYKFNVKDINSKKLNDQLANLTNKNINIEKKENEKKLQEEEKKKQEDELAKQKIELEEKKQELEKQKTLLEETKRQESIAKNEISPQPEPAKNTNLEEKSPSQEIVTKTNQANSNKNEFLLFINVAKIKGVLYKKYLDKIVAINPNVKLCRDEKNRIEIYFGPFENSEERTKILNKLLDKKFNEAYELEFTKEEFDKRCNY
jgi:hypothetical protein